jgi:hypothetical protein
MGRNAVDGAGVRRGEEAPDLLAASRGSEPDTGAMDVPGQQVR